MNLPPLELQVKPGDTLVYKASAMANLTTFPIKLVSKGLGFVTADGQNLTVTAKVLYLGLNTIQIAS